jgi:hypothetical protein
MDPDYRYELEHLAGLQNHPSYEVLMKRLDFLVDRYHQQIRQHYRSDELLGHVHRYQALLDMRDELLNVVNEASDELERARENEAAEQREMLRDPLAPRPADIDY